MPLTRSRNQPKRSLQTRREFDGNQNSPPSMRLRRKGSKNPRLPLYFNKKNMPPRNVRGVPTVLSGTEINWLIGSSPCTNYMPSIHTVSLIAQVRGSFLPNQKGLFFKIQTGKPDCKNLATWQHSCGQNLPLADSFWAIIRIRLRSKKGRCWRTVFKYAADSFINFCNRGVRRY